MKPLIDCIVFCGGKCGSTTLLNTLRNNKINSIKLHHKNGFKDVCKNGNKNYKSLYKEFKKNIKYQRSL